MYERTLTVRPIFSGRVLRLEVQEVELADGTRAMRELVRHPGAVGVVPRQPDGSLVLVRQFRKARESDSLEIVAGLLDPGEAPAAAAARELREETGLVAGTLEPLGEIWASPGYTDERIHLFFADCPAPAGARAPDEDERIEVVCLSPAAFEALIAAGQIHDAKTLAAWTLYRARCGPPPPGAAS